MHDPVGVNVVGYFQSVLGNGETARLVASALKQKEIPHSVISADFLTPNRTQEKKEYSFVKKGKYPINLFCIDIVYLLPFLRRFGRDFIKDKYNIMLFFWETDLLPEERLELFSYFDEVWVTSQYNQDALQSLTIPVYKIPHPMQLECAPKGAKKGTFGIDEKYTFLFCFDFFSNFHRKNPMALVEAFERAFPGRQDVQLVIKSINGHQSPKLFSQILTKVRRDVRIKWIDESISLQRRLDLMSACDCYISLHRSEGFGLTMAEAMLLGKPVIATGYSGNLDFMTPDNSFLCGYECTSVGQGHYPYPPTGQWANVSIDDAVQRMRFVVDHPEAAQGKAHRGRNDILAQHSMEVVGESIAQRLQSISVGKKSRDTSLKLYFDIARYYIKGSYRRAKRLFSV